MSDYISIGIPFYNSEKYLAFAIQSILSQSYKKWELILVDDGSTDSSLEIAQDFANKDKRIRLISDGNNKKLPFRLNQLINESKGDFVVRMDADDVMHPERLEKQLSFLKNHKKYDLVSSGLISIDNHNKVKGYRGVNKLFDTFPNPSLNYPIVHPSVMARKSWYLRNQYSEKYPRAEDFELWTRAITKNDFNMAVLPDLLLYYREEGNLSKIKIINTYKDLLKIYSNYSKSKLDLDVFKIYFKIIIVNFMFYTGNLQKMAKRRNKSFELIEIESDFQKILDEIVGCN